MTTTTLTLPGWSLYVFFTLVSAPAFRPWWVWSSFCVFQEMFLTSTMSCVFCYLQDSPIDVTIGPYETYEDGLFGYKVLPDWLFLLHSFSHVSERFHTDVALYFPSFGLDAMFVCSCHLISTTFLFYRQHLRPSLVSGMMKPLVSWSCFLIIFRCEQQYFFLPCALIFYLLNSENSLFCSWIKPSFCRIIEWF